MAASFLAHAPGNELPFISLIKLMYLADREGLLRWGSPLTNDDYFSLKNGPILSTVLNLISEGPEPGSASYWAEHISEPLPGRMIGLEHDPGSDELSEAEDGLIAEIFERFGALDRWDLVRRSHELPEWVDPGPSAIRIDIGDILTKNGVSRDDAATISDRIRNTQTVHSLFGAR